MPLGTCPCGDQTPGSTRQFLAHRNFSVSPCRQGKFLSRLTWLHPMMDSSQGCLYVLSSKSAHQPMHEE
eukprot:765744-Hanusia_phi.AAC.4